MSALTLEQQKAYIQALEEGGRLMEELRYEETRRMTDEERWAAIEMLQRVQAELPPRDDLPREDIENNGLVLQQRLFAKLHRR